MALSLEDGKSHLKLFYGKIRIGVAVAIIRTRPENMTVEDYITSLKTSFTLEQYPRQCGSVASSDVGYHKNDISEQQEELFNKLWAIFPTASDPNITEEYPDENEQMDASQDLFLDDVPDERVGGCETDCDEEVDSNIRFIEAIVQLKSIINSRSTIPAYKFKDVLELFLSQEESSENIPFRGVHSENLQNERIPCCALQYVMRTTETNRLLCISFERILLYIGQSLNDLHWDGYDNSSMIVHGIRTVRQLLDYSALGDDNLGFCLNACFKFTASLVDDITNEKEINKAEILERRCTLIIELGTSKHIIVKMISYLMEAILSFATDLENGVVKEQTSNTNDSCKCGPPFDPHRLENSWYLLYILQNLLNAKNEADADDNSRPQNLNLNKMESRDNCRIQDLWRSSWKGSQSAPETGNPGMGPFSQQDSIEPSTSQEWKEKLNHFIEAFSFDYPLLSYQLYECEVLFK